MTSSNEYQKKIKSVLSIPNQIKIKKPIHNKQKSIDISVLNKNSEKFCFELEQNSDSNDNTIIIPTSNLKNLNKKEKAENFNEILKKNKNRTNTKKYIMLPVIKKFLSLNEKNGVNKNKIYNNNNINHNNGKSITEENENSKKKNILANNNNKSTTNLTYNKIKYENPEFNVPQLEFFSELNECKIENEKIKKNLITQQILIIEMKKEIENLTKEKENLNSQNSELIKKYKSALNFNESKNNYDDLLSKHNELKIFDEKLKKDFQNKLKELKLLQTQNEDLKEENKYLLKEYVKLKKELEKNKDNKTLILKNNELNEIIENQKIEMEAINKVLKEKNFEILDYTKEIEKIKENILNQKLLTNNNILTENNNINKIIDHSYELIKEFSTKIKKNNDNIKVKNSSDIIINSLKDFLLQISTKNNGNIQIIDKLKYINEFINIILMKIESIIENKLYNEIIKEEFIINSKRNNSLSPSSNGKKIIIPKDNNYEKINYISKERSLENINTKYKKIKQYIYQGNDKNTNNNFNFLLDKRDFQRKNNKISNKVRELTDLINKNKTKILFTSDIKKTKIALSNDSNISINALPNKKKILTINRFNTFNETNLKISSNNSTIGKEYNYRLTTRNENSNTLNNSKNNDFFFQHKFNKLDIFNNNYTNKISCEDENGNFCNVAYPKIIQNSHTIEPNIVKNNILSVSSFAKIVDKKPLSSFETIKIKKKSWQKMNLNPKKLYKDITSHDINGLANEIVRPTNLKGSVTNEQNILTENKKDFSVANRVRKIKSPLDLKQIHKNKSFLY